MPVPLRQLTTAFCPGGRKSTLSAIRVCMNDAMQQLIANSGSGTESDQGGVQSDQSILAEFKRRLDDAKFVRLERNRRKKKALVKQLKMADGIIRPTKPGKCECLLFARTMKAWYPDPAALKRVTKLLRSRKILKKGRRTDTNTRQVLISRAWYENFLLWTGAQASKNGWCRSQMSKVTATGTRWPKSEAGA